MPHSIDRTVTDSQWPEGPIWRIKSGGDLDKTIDAMCENDGEARKYIANIAYVRDQYKSKYLDELEIEYGIVKNPLLTESERRNYLFSVSGATDGTGSLDELQDALNSAGFNVFVHSNSPAIDPAIILTESFAMVAGGSTAYAGHMSAFARLVGGYLLVNGDIKINTTPLYKSCAGTSNMFAGNGLASAGYFTSVKSEKYNYQIPVNSDSWPFVFFVGGTAERDSLGYITKINQVNLSILRQKDFENIILKYKPVHSWAGMVISYS